MESIIRTVLKKVETMEKPVINLYFTAKTRSGYTTYRPNVDHVIKDSLLSLIQDSLNQYKNHSIAGYNPTGSAENTVEYCKYGYVGNYSEIEDSFNSTQENVDTNLNPDELTFYCLEVEDLETDTNIRFFRRVTKFKKIYSKGIIAYFQGCTLNRIEPQVLGIDGFIDLMAVDGIIYIFNHVSLERIFKLNEKFSHVASKVIDILKEKNKIINFESFEDDCLNDQRFQKILAKMYDENNDIALALNNMETVRQVIELFELEIEIRENQIIYTDKSKLMDILRIIRDSYYKSLICEKLGVDNKIG